MQYRSLQHRTLLPSPVTPTTVCCFALALSVFFLELFLHSSAVAYWSPTDLGSSSFSVISFCLSIQLRGFQGNDTGLPFPSPVNHVSSELSLKICPSWVALNDMAHSFTELDKAVVHVVSLVSCM